MKKSRMQQMAYDYIKKNISEGKWENNIRLVEQDISNELSISRTPIREAINCLISEGYLIKEANRGVMVKKQTISETEFIERTQLLELLLSNYLFQLQIKQLSLNTEIILNHLEELDETLHFSENKRILKLVLMSFLEPLENKIMKQIIIKNFEQLNYIKFQNVDLNFLYVEIVFCMKNLSQNIANDNYDLGRKDIRVFFNRINLEVIDQQI